MILSRRFAGVLLFSAVMLAADSNPPSNVHDLVWHHRNLGKAFYENPMTQLKAVDEFRAAMELTSGSTRDETNYGLALLRAGRTNEAIAELLKVQKEDSSIPHTWFNLGMAFKKEFDHQRAIEQLEGMLKLVPDEPVSHYNLGVEYKLVGKPDLALAHFETAARLNPNFAAPHFQLYNAYRETGRKNDAARELDAFNEIKKRKAGAAVPEDPEWSVYAEIFDKVELDEAFDRENAATPPFSFAPRKVIEGAMQLLEKVRTDYPSAGQYLERSRLRRALADELDKADPSERGPIARQLLKLVSTDVYLDRWFRDEKDQAGSPEETSGSNSARKTPRDRAQSKPPRKII